MTHTWKIYDLKRVISNGLVTEITYACESEYSGSNSRKIGELIVVGSVDDEDFVPYEDLTQADVLEWVDSNIDKTVFETENSASIASSIVALTAITKSNGTPWQDN
tara:strand:- start:204 stop:521 length:318 start_codon:yes stop_codon:yes gene_type:complete